MQFNEISRENLGDATVAATGKQNGSIWRESRHVIPRLRKGLPMVTVIERNVTARGAHSNGNTVICVLRGTHDGAKSLR